MKATTSVIILILVTLALSSCSKAKIQSYTSDMVIKIDGSASDWENVPLFFNKKPAFVVGAVNDTNKLSLMLRFNDPSLTQMMFRRGFKIWFDEDEKFGLSFTGRTPYGTPDMRRRMVGDSLRSRSPQNMRIPVSLSLQDFEIVIKGSVRNIYQTDIPFLNAAFGYREGLFCFEFSVPLVAEKEKGYGALVSEKESVNLRFVINEMKRSTRDGSSVSRRGSGRSGGMSGRMRGGGRRGGGMKGAGAGMTRPDMSAIEFKATVQLAK